MSTTKLCFGPTSTPRPLVPAELTALERQMAAKGEVQKHPKIPRIPKQAVNRGGHVALGRIEFVVCGRDQEWTLPVESKSAGGIWLPKTDTFTEALYYGIVSRCGEFTCSQHVHAPKEGVLAKMAAEFPLLPGTLILHTNARPYRDDQNRVLFITCDHLHQWWTPDEVWPPAIEAMREK